MPRARDHHADDLAPAVEHLLLHSRRAPRVGPATDDDLTVFMLAGRVLRGDFAAAADAWNEHRAKLLAEWIAERPGTRPACWWWLEALEPRRLVEGAGMAMRPGVLAERLWRQRRGVPALAVQVRRPGDPDVSVESEATYLARHDALSAQERRRLPRAAFDPERVEYDYDTGDDAAGDVNLNDDERS